MMSSFPAGLALRLLCVLALTLPVCSQQLPTGFVDEEVATGFVQPVGLAFLPDGRMFVVEHHSGSIHLVAGGTHQLAGTVPNLNTLHFEQGLLGVAVDPQWPQWPYVYVAATIASPQEMQIIRFTASGDLSSPGSTNLTLGSPFVLLDGIPDQSVFHNGGTLRFGPDGMLYFGVGDDLSPCDAQDPEILSGVILRLDVSAVRGSVGATPNHATIAAPGNPFTGPNSQLVHAQGFRNPYRFLIDSLSGLLYVGDVGQQAFEELDEVGPGQNFGWPHLEASAPYSTTCGAMPTGLEGSIADYANGPGSASIIPITAPYRTAPGAALSFGPSYAGSLFYADFWQGFIRRMVHDGTSWVPAPAVPGQPSTDNWGEGFTFVADSMVGPDGAIYYVKWTPGSIRRIRPDLGTTQLNLVSGNHQVGNADWPLENPLVVRLDDLNGQPFAGAPVTFSVSAGTAQLDVQPITTDAQGIARCGVRLPASTSVNPILIRASAPGSPPVEFSVTWRGLVVDYDAPTNSYLFSLRHSEANSPVSLIIGMPNVYSAITPWGEIKVDTVSGVGVAALDGLGIVRPPNPAIRTAPYFPSFSFGIGNLPSLGGYALVAQGFAIDWGRFPADDSILISNAVEFIVP